MGTADAPVGHPEKARESSWEAGVSSGAPVGLAHHRASANTGGMTEKTHDSVSEAWCHLFSAPRLNRMTQDGKGIKFPQWPPLEAFELRKCYY